MRVVSGPVGRETVHFEAPPATGAISLPRLMGNTMLVRARVAHSVNTRYI